MKEDIASYLNELFAKEDKALQDVREKSERFGLPSISIAAHEGRFLQLLVRSNNAKKALEIGTLGGYSGIWIARGLDPTGRLITLEKEELHAQVARENFQYAGLDSMIEIRVGDAHEQLENLSDEVPFDFVFIDAEKPGYEDYFSWSVDNVRVGGVIAAHNVLAYGHLLDDTSMNENVERIRRFNQMAANDSRIISTLYPVGDGILAAVKVTYKDATFPKKIRIL